MLLIRAKILTMQHCAKSQLVQKVMQNGGGHFHSLIWEKISFFFKEGLPWHDRVIWWLVSITYYIIGQYSNNNQGAICEGLVSRLWRNSKLFYFFKSEVVSSLINHVSRIMLRNELLPKVLLRCIWTMEPTD